jgi:hypothetical protein
VAWDAVNAVEIAQDFGFVENISGLDYNIRIYTADEAN